MDIQQGESTEERGKEGKTYTGCRKVAWAQNHGFFQVDKDFVE